MFESPSRILLYRDQIQSLLNNENVQPVTIDLELSWECNHNCEWCAYEEWHKPSYLKYEKILEIVKHCKANNIKWIIISGGGEPTLHPDFDKIIGLLEKEKISYTLITNGSMLDKYNQLFGNYCRYIRVSLDAASSLTYEKVHGVNATEFNRIINSLVSLKTRLKNCYFGLAFVITETNYSEIEDFISIADRLRFNEVLIRKDLRYPEKKYRVDRDLQIRYPNLLINWRESEKHVVLSSKCFGIKLKMVVDPDGHVPLCLRNRDISIGNINEQNISDFWNSEDHNFKISNIDTFSCSPCRFTECNNLIQSHVYNNSIIDII